MKKFLGLCMALCLCLVLLPATALAANEATTVYVGNVELKGSTDSPAYATTNADTGAVTVGGGEETYNIKWDGETLTLQNATIKKAGEHNNESIAVYLASGNMNLVLVGKNTVDAPDSESVSSCGIHVGGSLTISGQENASLTVFGGDTTNGNSCGIYANGTITMESGTVNATGESASADSYGINTPNAVTINGGTVTAVGGNAGGKSYGIYTSGNSTSIIVNGGTVTATSGEAQGDSCGIFAEHQSNECSVTINGGTVTATADNAVGAGWYSCGIRVEGSITINDGTVNATGKTCSSRSSYGIYARKVVTINDGTVTATAGGGDGKQSIGIFTDGGDVIISGGNVTGIGGTGPLSCGIATNTTLEIKSATVKAEGGAASTQFSCGLYAAQTCSIEGSTVTATGGTAEQGNSSGIYSGDTSSVQLVEVTIKNATVTATGGTATNGKSSGISATNTKADVEVTIENAAVTTTGGSAGTGNSYGILAETTGTDKSADVTINGNSVVRANMTDTEGADDEPISGETTKQENSIIFENGVGTVYGTVTLREDLTVAAGETLTIPQDATLTIPAGTTLTNNGKIQNDGNLQVKGEITGNAVTGSGTIQGSGQWPGKPEPVPIPPTYAVTAPETPGGTVTVSPSRASRGRTVTITATPDLGFTLESLTVLDSRGQPLELTNKGNGKYTFTMPASRVTVEATFAPAPLPFEDVTSGAWYESAVRYAYFHNIMEGMSETEFAPATALTRAMAVQILYNLEGQPIVSGDNEFTDVSGWYETAVTWAAETGVAEGYGDGTFQPGDSITRQEFAQMLYNYAKYKGYNLTAEGDLSQFPDSGSVADWAKVAMSWANGNKLINGHDDGAIDAAGAGTRAQAASILMKLDQNITA